jgi:hypothetical protein
MRLLLHMRVGAAVLALLPAHTWGTVVPKETTCSACAHFSHVLMEHLQHVAFAVRNI